MVTSWPVHQYDPEARLIVVDVKKEMGDRKADLTQMAYYMEKDVRVSISECTHGTSSSHLLFLSFFVPQVKILPLFKNQEKFEPMVGGQKLQMENILVYYVDEEAPTFTMQNLSGGIIAVIVVVVLAVVIGLLVLVSAQLAHFVVCAASVLPEWTHAAFSPQFFLSKRGKKRYNKTQVSFLWLSQLLRDTSRVPDNKTLSFSNSKERWRPCKLSVLNGALGVCHFHNLTWGIVKEQSRVFCRFIFIFLLLSLVAHHFIYELCCFQTFHLHAVVCWGQTGLVATSDINTRQMVLSSVSLYSLFPTDVFGFVFNKNAVETVVACWCLWNITHWRSPEAKWRESRPEVIYFRLLRKYF